MQYDKMGIFSVRSAYKMMEETKRRRVDWLEGRKVSSNGEGGMRAGRSFGN
jgi:hypothetical protein